ncbi:MAG: glycine cleavage system aminomethyltransferase GcvT [Candidatus Muiribacteriota bacterium]
MKTPFYESHKKYNGKFVNFYGWKLPVQYEGIIKEHHNVRESAGVFDVSHMGEITIKGKQAQKCTDYLVTNSVYKMKQNEALYTPICKENGTCVDDLLVYKFSENNFLLVVNAANVEKDFKHIKKISKIFDVEVRNETEKYGQLAIQGPNAAFIVNKLLEEDICVDNIGFFKFIKTNFAGVEAVVSRTGYTGEDGFEIYFTQLDKADELWKKIFEAGAQFNLKPAGLGARDTLRFEAGLMLYGNELNEDTTPLEARLKWTVDFDKEFNGKEALLKQKIKGIKKRLCAVEILDKGGLARKGHEIFKEGKKIGEVTSGTKSPTLSKTLALAYVDKGFSKPKNFFEVKVRKKMLKARTRKFPFKKKTKLTSVCDIL